MPASCHYSLAWGWSRDTHEAEKRYGHVLVTAGMTFAAYKLLLTNEARRSLRETGSSLARGYYALLDMLDGLVGEKTGLDQLDANRRQIQQEWERLGY